MIEAIKLKEMVCNSINLYPDKFLTKNKKWLEIHADMIDSRKRNREIVEARQFCHYFTKLSTTKAGKEFGNVDHCVVLHSRKRLNQLLTIDDRIEAIWKDILFQLINNK